MSNSPASQAFASHLAKYAYSPSSRTPRRDRSVKAEFSDPTTDSLSGPSTPTKLGPYTTSPRSITRLGTSSSRKRSLTSDQPKTKNEDDDYDDLESISSDDAEFYREKIVKRTRQPDQKAKYIKKPRGFAGPEVYQHLRPINDLLKEGLDIVFCGINPGKRSSTLGHHFAHPTNKFWRSLHQSGLTTRLLSPSEDYTLPDDFNLGLTNLVDRPTSEQAELSTLEMKVNVLAFTLKVLKHRPRLVCFVGKKIWDIYEGVASKTAVNVIMENVSSKASPPSANSSVKVEKEEILFTNGKDVKVENDSEMIVKPESSISNAQGISMSEPGSNTTPRKTSKAKRGAGITPSPSPRNKKPPIPPMKWTQPRTLRLPLPRNDGGLDYCYFWVVPNTSGLERTPLAEQVVLFGHLRAFSEMLKENRLPLDLTFRDIDLDGVRMTVENIKQAAALKST